MIDPKYLDMLKSGESLSEHIGNFLKETVDNLIVGAICEVSQKPLPKELNYEKVNLGYHKINGRKLIMAIVKDKGGITAEFSEDFKTAYVEKSIGGYEVVPLTPETSAAAKGVFDKIEGKVLEASRMILNGDPVQMAIDTFISEVRYGTEEELCTEFLNIYRTTVEFLLISVPNEEIRDTMRRPLLENIRVTNIKQFLETNGADATNVHIVG